MAGEFKVSIGPLPENIRFISPITELWWTGAYWTDREPGRWKIISSTAKWDGTDADID